MRYKMTPDRTLPAIVCCQTCSMYSFWTCLRTEKQSYCCKDLRIMVTRKVKTMVWVMPLSLNIWK